MQALIQRLQQEARYLGNGIIKLDSFLNHCVDPLLMGLVGRELAQRLDTGAAVSKVVTAETSGIAPALMAAQYLGVPMIYARKKKPVTMAAATWSAEVRSHTKGDVITLHISSEYLDADDTVLVIDDVLGYGDAALAMAHMTRQSGATLAGMGFVVEKVYEHGRRRLETVAVPVVSLALVDLMDGELSVTAQSHAGGHYYG